MFASVNQNRDYRIFEDFAFFMMEYVCKKQLYIKLKRACIRLRFYDNTFMSVDFLVGQVS